MPRLPLVISLLTVRALFGQSIPVDPQNPSPNAVVQLKRTPASPAATSQKTDTFVDHFDFSANVRRWRSQRKLPSRRVQFLRRPAGQLVYPRVIALQPTLRFPLLRSKPLSSAPLGGHNKTEPRRGRTVGCCSPSERAYRPWCAHRCASA
jgi:hypothetical protein